jgi:SnoaL-like domain
MSVNQDSRAVAVALAHIEAWSNHDFDAARDSLASDVKVTATSTGPGMADTKLGGIDDYMRGLVAFAQGVRPGSARVVSTLGDERNALVTLTVNAAFGPAPWPSRWQTAREPDWTWSSSSSVAAL